MNKDKRLKSFCLSVGLLFGVLSLTAVVVDIFTTKSFFMYFIGAAMLCLYYFTQYDIVRLKIHMDYKNNQKYK